MGIGVNGCTHLCGSQKTTLGVIFRHLFVFEKRSLIGLELST